MISAEEAKQYIKDDQEFADQQALKIANVMLKRIAEPAIRKTIARHRRRAHVEEPYDEMMHSFFKSCGVSRIYRDGSLDVRTQEIDEMSIQYASELLREAGYDGGFWVGVTGESLLNGGRGTFKALMFEARF